MTTKIFIKSSAVCCPDAALLEAFQLTGYPVDNSLIPANIRRRTSLTTRMAITAATLACQQAQVNTATLPSVFASLGGEIQVTDALCRLLPNPEELLSPTQFHNSVHNTTAGYWSILNQCQAQATAIAAADDTFAMALLEAWTQLQCCPGDLLLVCYDEYWPQYLAPPIGENAFACALVLSTENTNAQAAITRPEPFLSAERAAYTLDEQWSATVDAVPAAAAVFLLKALTTPSDNTLIPLNNRGAIWFTHVETQI